MLCYKLCNEERKRSKQNYEKCYSPVKHYHKDDSANDGCNTRKKLSKAHKQTVRKLVYVRDNTVNYVARFMRVDIGKRQFLNFADSIASYIAHYRIGNGVVEDAHYPLQNRGKNDDYRALYKQRSYKVKADLSLNAKVDCITDNNRQIQRHCNGCKRKYKCSGKFAKTARAVGEYAC